MIMAIKVRVNQLDYGQRIVFAFLKEGKDPGKAYIWDGRGSWQEFPFGETVVEEKVTLVIPPEGKAEILQQMADILGAMGYKPEKLKAAVQEIERVENHLLDTIAVRDRLLTIIEGNNASVKTTA
jgi:hypothetical protein